ncbi:MAG: hypothetical protein C4542_06025 [Dehalococcoidia bacterium]|nr:MAG: hypothetical protein C4542_06025 [Dehalococcoidia bacterium]
MKAQRLIVVVMMTSLVAVTGCFHTNTVYAPDLTFITPLPLVNVSQMRGDYASDVKAADARYAGQQFYFGQLKVTEVSKALYPLRATEEYVLVGNVKFKPRYASDLWDIGEGTLIEVTGQVQGYLWNYIVVQDCLIRIVSGASTGTPGY